MPRTFVRRERKRDLVRRFKVYKPWWVDPFVGIQGSSIEKMVMAEFVRRGIYFEHTPQTNSLNWLPGLGNPTWEPDFLLPQYKIWIEIQGSYFHSLPGQIETDSLRFASITLAGWKPIAWWEFDIRTRLLELFDAVPEFYMANMALQAAAAKKYGVYKNLPFLEGGFDASGKAIDHLAGLRKALHGRARPPQFTVRRRYPGVRHPK